MSETTGTGRSRTPAWHDLPTPEQQQAAWAAGESWGLVRDLRRARETIRKTDPVLAMRLDVLHPIPPCPHKVRQERTPYGALPRWSCAGCGIPMRCGPGNSWRAVTAENASRQTPDTP